jgi:hypothetical protein
MKQILFTTRAKWCYGISSVILLCGILLCVLGRIYLGTMVAIVGISFAFSVADANGHLTIREKSSEKKDR